MQIFWWNQTHPIFTQDWCCSFPYCLMSQFWQVRFSIHRYLPNSDIFNASLKKVWANFQAYFTLWNLVKGVILGVWFDIRHCLDACVFDFLMLRQSFLFYENSHNSGTKSRKIVPKMGNDPPLRGLQMGPWPKLGTYGKNWIFRPKTKISGPKKPHCFPLTMFWPHPEKVVQRKKLPFPK